MSFLHSFRVWLSEMLLYVNFAVLAKRALHLHLPFTFIEADMLLVCIDALDRLA